MNELIEQIKEKEMRKELEMLNLDAQLIKKYKSRSRHIQIRQKLKNQICQLRGAGSRDKNQFKALMTFQRSEQQQRAKKQDQGGKVGHRAPAASSSPQRGTPSNPNYQITVCQKLIPNESINMSSISFSVNYGGAPLNFFTKTNIVMDIEKQQKEDLQEGEAQHVGVEAKHNNNSNKSHSPGKSHPISFQMENQIGFGGELKQPGGEAAADAAELRDEGEHVEIGRTAEAETQVDCVQSYKQLLSSITSNAVNLQNQVQADENAAFQSGHQVFTKVKIEYDDVIARKAASFVGSVSKRQNPSNLLQIEENENDDYDGLEQVDSFVDVVQNIESQPNFTQIQNRHQHHQSTQIIGAGEQNLDIGLLDIGSAVIPAATTNMKKQNHQQTLRELVLLEEIEDFINRMQLTTDEMILRYIYPRFFKERMREKFLAQYDSQHQDDTIDQDIEQEEGQASAESRNQKRKQEIQMRFDNAYDQLMPKRYGDPKQISYVPIRKDALLQDIKQFLYDYTVSGSLYPHHHQTKFIQTREESAVNDKIAKFDNILGGVFEDGGGEKEEEVPEQQEVVDAVVDHGGGESGAEGQEGQGHGHKRSLSRQMTASEKQKQLSAEKQGQARHRRYKDALITQNNSKMHQEFIEALEELENLEKASFTKSVLREEETCQTKKELRQIHLKNFYSRLRAEECIFHNSAEIKKERAIRALRILHTLKQKIAKHLKGIYNQRVNNQKEGQIGESRYDIGRSSHIGGGHGISFHSRQQSYNSSKIKDINHVRQTEHIAPASLNHRNGTLGSHNFRGFNKLGGTAGMNGRETINQKTVLSKIGGNQQMNSPLIMNQLNRLTMKSTGKNHQLGCHLGYDHQQRLTAYQTGSSDKERALLREQDVDASDIFVQKGKLLINHLLEKYNEVHGMLFGSEAKGECGTGEEAYSVQDLYQYQEFLFNLIIPKQEFQQIESINDFVDLIQQNFMQIIDFERSAAFAGREQQYCGGLPKSREGGLFEKGGAEASGNYEILFIEKVDETRSLLVHSKDKTSIDLEGKDLLIFLLQQPESYMRHMDDIQTQTLPQFEYIFNPSKPKSMGQGPDFFKSQRKHQDQDQLQFCSLSDCVCSICQQCVLVTDEYIRLMDCHHIYHRICLIHHIAQITNKRFFLTRQEQLNEFDPQEDSTLSLCPNCRIEDGEVGYLRQGRVKGYRKHIIFDLLKDKADVFYNKMIERKAVEPFVEGVPGEDSEDNEVEADSGSCQGMQIFRNVEDEDDIQANEGQRSNQRSEENDKQVTQKYYQVKWKNNRNQYRGQDLNLNDCLNDSIRNSVKPPNELSVCDDRDEINSIYSELDQSMAQQRNQLIANPYSECSVCLRKRDSCIVLSQQCLHQACIDCIEKKITEPIQKCLDTRDKIQVDFVQCKAEEWCQVIIPLEILLPLLNLSRRDHLQEIECIKELYEESVCCPGEGNYQFIDQLKWMAHCLPCGGKFCCVCLHGEEAENNNNEVQSVRPTSRPTLAQCRCIRCPQCDSANTVNREASKSYYCHLCAKNFCWLCHQQVNLCHCFTNQKIVTVISAAGIKEQQRQLEDESGTGSGPIGPQNGGNDPEQMNSGEFYNDLDNPAQYQNPGQPVTQLHEVPQPEKAVNQQSTSKKRSKSSKKKQK